MFQDSFFKTDAEVKEKFFAELENGAKKHCPCCGRYAQIYKRQINSSMALQGIAVLRLGGATDYVHMSEVLLKVSEILGGGVLGGFEFTKLSYWGLAISKSPAVDEVKKKTSGMWKLTPDGVLFLKNQLKVKKYALIYDDTVLRFEGKEVGITEAFKTHFNYQELMEGIKP